MCTCQLALLCSIVLWIFSCEMAIPLMRIKSNSQSCSPPIRDKEDSELTHDFDLIRTNLAALLSRKKDSSLTRNAHAIALLPAIVTGDEGALPRSKPFKYTYEKEIVMYAYFRRLDYFSTECIYAPFAYRGFARAFLKDLEAVRSSAVLDIIHSGEALCARSEHVLPVQGNCSRCGYIASNRICKACVLLENLNRGTPRLAVGKSRKADALAPQAASHGVVFARGVPTSSPPSALCADVVPHQGADVVPHQGADVAATPSACVATSERIDAVLKTEDVGGMSTLPACVDASGIGIPSLLTEPACATSAPVAEPACTTAASLTVPACATRSTPSFQ